MYAEKLRKESWKRNDICGITYPPVAELISHHHVPGGSCLKCKRGSQDYIAVHNVSFPCDHRINPKVGPIFPYLGTKTKDKSQGAAKWIQVSDVPSNMRAPLKVQNMVGWGVKSQSSLARCVSRIVSSISDIEPETLQNTEGSIQGAIDHRYKTEGDMRGGFPNTSVNPLTHLSVHLNTTQLFSKGGINHNLFYQGIISYSVGIVSEQMFNQRSISPSTHHHFSCYDCMMPMDEKPMEATKEFKDSYLPSLIKNPYCFISKDKISVVISPVVQLPISERGFSGTSEKMRVLLETRIGIQNLRKAGDRFLPIR